jgi:hypothetical protein
MLYVEPEVGEVNGQVVEAPNLSVFQRTQNRCYEHLRVVEVDWYVELHSQFIERINSLIVGFPCRYTDKCLPATAQIEKHMG